MKISILLLCISAPLVSIAQFYDNTWILGYDNNADTTDKFGLSVITFPNASIKIEQNPNLLFNFSHTNASYSDSKGVLKAFTNGVHIGNSAGITMDGGQFLGTKYSQKLGYIWHQWTLMLPAPQDSNTIYCLYEDEGINAEIQPFATHLYYAKIDLRANNGLGKVVSKDNVILSDSLAVGKLVATTHANGRDWWVLVNRSNTNQFYRILITPEGPKVVGTQNIGPVVIDGVGQAAFSPDGSRYALYNGISTEKGTNVNIFGFDRCTGLLSNPLMHHIEGGFYGGVAFSPNSRFLYANVQLLCYQYDMEDTDPITNRIIVAEYDGHLSPYWTHFFYLLLAPDGKIYSNIVSGSNAFHVINFPDKKGVDCHYAQHAIKMKTLNAQSMPNFPSYRLGPLDESACDTLNLNNLPQAWWRTDRDSTNFMNRIFHDLSFYQPESWLWDFGDPASGAANSSIKQHPEHEFSKTGAYKVCLTVRNAYADHTLCRTLLIGITGTQDKEIEESITVIPSFFSNHIRVNIDRPLPTLRFFIFDAIGRIVRQDYLLWGSNDFDTYDLPSGVYFWVVTSVNEKIKQGRIVKEP